MNVRLLGTSAGGGFPQWNCNCLGCWGARCNPDQWKPRTQSSIAVSADGKNWVLINASPDILTQIRLWPQARSDNGIRGSRISAIILVDAQIDHAAGLLMLREGERLQLYSTAAVRDDVTDALGIIPVLEKYCGVTWSEILDNGSFEIPDIGPLCFRAIYIDGKAPPYARFRDNERRGNNIALVLEDTGFKSRLFYAPGIAQLNGRLLTDMSQCDCVLVDGTFWTDDELIRLDIKQKRGSEMGHLALSGNGGLIESLSRLPNSRRILVHINNTNPILNERSPERRLLDNAGIETGYDGMEIKL